MDEKTIAKIQEYLDRLTFYAKIIWLGPFAEARVPYHDVRKFDGAFKLNKAAFELAQKLDRDLRAKFQNVSTTFAYVSFAEVIDINRDFLLVEDCWTYMNGDHFSRCGEEIVAKRIARVFNEVFERRSVIDATFAPPGVEPPGRVRNLLQDGRMSSKGQ